MRFLRMWTVHSLKVVFALGTSNPRMIRRISSGASCMGVSARLARSAVTEGYGRDCLRMEGAVESDHGEQRAAPYVAIPSFPDERCRPDDTSISSCRAPRPGDHQSR